MMATLNPAEWQRKMNAIRKLLRRKIEMGEVEVERRCTAAYELFVSTTSLKAKRSLPQALKDKDWPHLLAALQEGMDCDPFLNKDAIHALMLEAWSSQYDLARLRVGLQRHEIDVMKQKPGVLLPLIQEAEVVRGGLENVAAGINVKFAHMRVVNLIDKGLYKPPATAEDQRKMRARSFLALSGDTSALRCVKQDKGPAALGKFLGVAEVKQSSNSAANQKQSQNQRESQQQAAASAAAAANQVELTTGAQPLHYASSRGRTDEVRMLLAAKANVNAQTLRGFTPLHFAYQYEHSACVDLLLQHGARIDITSALGKTPGQMKVSQTAVIAPPLKPFY